MGIFEFAGQLLPQSKKVPNAWPGTFFIMVARGWTGNYFTTIFTDLLPIFTMATVPGVMPVGMFA